MQYPKTQPVPKSGTQITTDMSYIYTTVVIKIKTDTIEDWMFLKRPEEFNISFLMYEPKFGNK